MGRYILVSGNDDVSVKARARSVMEELCGSSYESDDSLELIPGDADKLKPASILSSLIDSIMTPPFLSAEKKIWLKNFPFDLMSKMEKSKDFEEAFDKVRELLSEPLPDYLTVLISGSGLDRRSSFYKMSQKKAELHYLQKIDSSSKNWQEELKGFIYDYLQSKGATISRDAMSFLSESVGTDSGRIRNEIDKLLAFVHPSKEIGLDACRKVASRTPEAGAWEFSNALLSRKLESAFEAIAVSLDSNRGSEMAILYSALGSLRSLSAVKVAGKIMGLSPNAQYPAVKSALEGLSEEKKAEIGTSIANMNPYRFYMLLKDSSRFSDSEIPHVVSELLRANKSMVSGSVLTQRAALEQLAIRVCRQSK